MSDETIIPPVEAGTVTSNLCIEYDHGQRGDGGFTATGEHQWTFDGRQYHEATGLHLGFKHPYVAQENGHVLRLVTKYRWNHSTVGETDSYSLYVEGKAVRGLTSIEATYWTRAGYYELDHNMAVTRTEGERQPYEARKADGEIPHREPRTLDGCVFRSGEQMVRQLHSGSVAVPLTEQLQHLIRADSPDDAVTPDEYKDRQPEPTPAD